MGENKLKKRFSGILTCAMVATLVQAVPASETIANYEVGMRGDEAAQTTTGSSIELVEAEHIIEVTTPQAISLEGWNHIAFGDGIAPEDHTLEVTDHTITMTSDNTGHTAGKISGKKDGINFYCQELSADSHFEIKVKAKVDGWYSANNQVSFGLMLRDTIGTHGETGDDAVKGARMLGVGALKQKMESFVRQEESKSFTDGHIFIDKSPAMSDTYELSIKKSGDWYEFSVNGVVTEAYYEDQFTDYIYAGIYTTRAVSVEYSDLEVTEFESVSSLTIESMPTKLSYLEEEALDLSGLVVKADGKEIDTKDLIVSGYNANQIGTQTVTLHYAGQTVSFDVVVEKLTCTKVEVTITPAKTTYYLNDEFDETGMVVEATYNSGKVVKLSSNDYEITPVDLTTPGIKTVTVTYIDGEQVREASFTITVLEDQLTGLEIARMPVKTLYYIGEDFEEKGLAVKAVYGDTKVLLERNEFEITKENFNPNVAGEKTVTVHHKGVTVNISVTVKAAEATHIEVTSLPKTTYTVGESFTSEGIVVSKVYDNGDREILPLEAYTIDASQFNGDEADSYSVQIIPTDESFKTIEFVISVRDPITYDWKYVTFGQSTGETKNYIQKLDNGAVRIVAEEGAGKITNSFQDGITYYYTELDNTTDNFVLSADIKVNEFAKPSPDNQEGFGIMARDAIGVHNDSSVFYSNIAAVGGYRGCTQMLMRSGVTAADSTGAATGLQEETVLGSVRPSAANTSEPGSYRLTLKKDNTGFTGYLTTPDGTVEKLYYQPDALGVQNDKLYVGFYAARLADIEVSNIELEVTSKEADAPKVEAPQQSVTPNFTISSLSASSVKDYDLKMYANVNGTVTIKQGEDIIGRDIPVTGGTIYSHKTVLKENAINNFTVTFTPDTDQNLTAYNKIVKNISVEMKTYGVEGEAIYVSPIGSAAGEGTIESPLSVDRAINFVRPGQTIYLLEGTYKLTNAIGIQPGNDGTADAMKTLSAYPGAKVTIDAGKKVSGFNLDGNYWHIFGIDFTGATSTGLRVGGSNNIVELCNTYSNGDTGLQISRYGNGGYDTWPANNLILNCTSYDNIDSSENNADGFAAKLTCGPGNVFKGCISHNNIDDAWDLFAKGSTGPIGAVTLEDCIAYGNGTLTNGYVGKGDKNGFKLGGEGIAVKHTIKNSISFNNGATGFSSNSNPAVISENCVSFDNEGANFDWRVYTDVEPQFVATGNVSYRSTPGEKDIYPESLISKDNYYYDGEKSVNSEGTVLTDANFKSLITPEGYERDAEGNIIFGDFLKFIEPNTDSNNQGGSGNNPGYDSDDSNDDDNSDDSNNSSSDHKGDTVLTVDELIQAAINENKQAELVVTETKPSVQINMSTIENLVKNNALLKVKTAKASIEFGSDFLSGNIFSQYGDQAALKVTATRLNQKTIEAIKAQFNEESGLKVIGDTNLTVDFSIEASKSIEKFNEPATLTIDLTGVTAINPAKLTLVKYELQTDGTYQVVKLGGSYDEKTKTFTGRVNEAGIYGIMEAENLLKVSLKVGELKSSANGETIENDVVPEITDGITMVPLRFIAENLGAEVKWNNTAKSVIVNLGEETITFDKKDGLVIKNNRTLVPLRYVSESLGAHVLWVPSMKEIEIVK